MASIQMVGVATGRLVKQGYKQSEHLFFSCCKVNERWKEVHNLLQGAPALMVNHHCLFKAITSAIHRHKCQPGPLILVRELCNSIWKERNEATYSNFLSRLPGWVGPSAY